MADVVGRLPEIDLFAKGFLMSICIILTIMASAVSGCASGVGCVHVYRGKCVCVCQAGE